MFDEGCVVGLVFHHQDSEFLFDKPVPVKSNFSL
jgi:hypothetical protein